MSMENESEWLRCPRCGQKTRIKVRKDTKLVNFPLFCPKCKLEVMICVEDMKIKMV